MTNPSFTSDSISSCSTCVTTDTSPTKPATPDTERATPDIERATNRATRTDTNRATRTDTNRATRTDTNRATRTYTNRATRTDPISQEDKVVSVNNMLLKTMLGDGSLVIASKRHTGVIQPTSRRANSCASSSMRQDRGYSHLNVQGRLASDLGIAEVSTLRKLQDGKTLSEDEKARIYDGRERLRSCSRLTKEILDRFKNLKIK